MPARQLLVLRSGIQGDMSARVIRAPLVPASSVDRHLYVPGVKKLDAANALQPYTAMGHQLLTWVRPPVSRDLRETVGSGRPYNPWFDRSSLCTATLAITALSACNRRSRARDCRRHCSYRDPGRSRCLFLVSAACRAGRHAGLVKELAFTRGGRADDNPGRVQAIMPRGQPIRRPRGERHDTHRIPDSTNRQVVCCQNETPQSPCDPMCPLCNHHTHVYNAKMTCGLASGQTNSLKQRYNETSVESCGRAWGSHQLSPQGRE